MKLLIVFSTFCLIVESRNNLYRLKRSTSTKTQSLYRYNLVANLLLEKKMMTRVLVMSLLLKGERATRIIKSTIGQEVQ